MNLATSLTVLRIILILPIIILTNLRSIEFDLAALILFIIAALTDYFDGYIARSTNTVSSLGALLDLVADKLLVCLLLVWLAYLNNSILFVIPVLIILSRELAISAIRQFFSQLKPESNLPVSLLGKSKTTIQLISIGFIIISPELGVYFKIFTISFLWLASIISIYSMYRYLINWHGKF